MTNFKLTITLLQVLKSSNLFVLRSFLIFWFVIVWQISLAQSPVANYTITGSACKGQQIEISNQSLNADRYEWDFCLDDFYQLKSKKALVPLPDIGPGYGQEGFK